MITIM
jgi:hypothetical protein